MNSEELKHCPFCGSLDEMVIKENTTHPVMNRPANVISCDITHWCKVDGLPRRRIHVTGRDRAEAITAWNNRADQPWYSMDSAPSSNGSIPFLVEVLGHGCVVAYKYNGKIWNNSKSNENRILQATRWQPLPNTTAPTVHTYNPETHTLVERAKVPEDVGAAVDILVGHNKWRRGDAHEPSCTSFELGKVIEKVCQAAALVAEGE